MVTAFGPKAKSIMAQYAFEGRRKPGEGRHHLAWGNQAQKCLFLPSCILTIFAVAKQGKCKD
jgi:hypothetical protein